VVGIIKDEVEDKPIVGRIDLLKREDYRDKQKRESSGLIQLLSTSYNIYFKPLNKRLPWFKLGKVNPALIAELVGDKKEEDIDQIVDTFESCYFSGLFYRWERQSFYPLIEIVKKIGSSGDIEIECLALLTEH
jgi:exoribonuclease R